MSMGKLTQVDIGIRVQQVVWLKDGKRFAVLGWPKGEKDSNRPEMGVVNIDGTNYHMHVPYIYGGIVASPTQNLVAMTSSDELIIYSPDDESSRKIKMDSIAAQMGSADMAWSPNGKYLAVHAHRKQDSEEIQQLFVLTSDGRILIVKEVKSFLVSISWNNSNDHLVYYPNSDEVTIISLMGEVVRQIPRAHNTFYNPKQNALVYLQSLQGEKEKYGLMLETQNGKQSIDYFNYRNSQNQPPNHYLWSPDGSKLLYDDHRSQGILKSKKAWMIFDMESKKASHLLDLESDNGKLIFPVWSPDSAQIAYVENNSENIVICSL